MCTYIIKEKGYEFEVGEGHKRKGHMRKMNGRNGVIMLIKTKNMFKPGFGGVQL